MYLYFQILDLYLGREEVEVRAQRDKYVLLLTYFGFISYLSLSCDKPACSNQTSSANVVVNLPRLYMPRVTS